MKVRSYPNQPSDLVLAEIELLIELKRNGEYLAADIRYLQLYEREKEDIFDVPYILKSWAKVVLCLGDYDRAIDFFNKAANGFLHNGNNDQAWQCNDQSLTIKNRNLNKEDFIDYVKSASGGSLSYPNNY